MLTMNLSTAKAEIINKIVATVGDIPITRYEVESFNPERLREINAIENDESRRQALRDYYRKTLSYLVDQYVVVVAAEKQGIVVTDKDAQQALDSVLESNNMTESELEKILKDEGLTMAKYMWQLKMEIVNQRLQNTVLRNMVVVTPEDVRAYIKRHPDSFNVSETYEVRMITVDSEKTAKEVRKKALGGAAFADLAKEYSTDGMASEGGYLGWVDISAIDSRVAGAIRPLRNGGVSEPLHTGESYQLFSVSAHKPMEENIDPATAEKVHRIISEELYGKAFQTWLEKQRETILVEYFVDWM